METCSVNVQTANSLKVYEQAKIALGTSLVPVGDDQEVGCAISVSVLIGDKCDINIIKTLSTFELLNELVTSPLFKEIPWGQQLPGDIALCATGTQPKSSPFAHGHCGVWAIHGVCSNNSYNGLWQEFYTHESWIAHYETIGLFKTRFFRAL